MRTIEVTLLEDETAQVHPQHIYMGEHSAARLAVTLNGRLLDGFDFYTLAFDLMDSGKRIPVGNIYPQTQEEDASPIAYLQEGVIYCTLPAQLTACSYIRVQVEAYQQQDGKCRRLEKSAPFLIAFEDSLGGEAQELYVHALGHMAQLMAQIDQLRQTLQINVLQWEAIEGRPAFTAAADAITAQLPVFVPQPGDADESAQAATTQFVARRVEASAHEIALQVEESLENTIAGWWEAELETALTGCPVQKISLMENGASHLLLPGVRYRIRFAADVSEAELLLDNTESSPAFAQEFSFLLEPPAEGPADLVIAYTDGPTVQLPEGFTFEAGRRYEVNILDGYALAASWEVSP
ncbi:MAG: hypothetical protein LBQ33_02610 [Oscillospiraceae bacterium]|jgi:hypothetical protein|nr:hypothetical protein [Oscillospiraceae bacterium]